MRGKAGKYGVGDLARVGWDVIYGFGALRAVLWVFERRDSNNWSRWLSRKTKSWSLIDINSHNG